MALLKLATTSTGIDVTGNATFADNGKAIFGAGSDLEILSNGTDGLIRNGNATGEIRMESDDRIIFADRGFNEVFAVFNDDDDVKLYHDGNQKLATTSTGIDVTGLVDATDLFRFGVDNSEIANNYLRFKPSGAAYIDHSTVGQSVNFRVSSASSLDTTPLVVTSTGIDVTGVITTDGLTVASTLATIGSGGVTNQATELRLEGTSNAANGAYLRGRRGGSSSFLIGDTAGALGSGTGLINYVYGANPWLVYTNATERMRIDSSGNVGIGTSSPTSLGNGAPLVVDNAASGDIGHFEGAGSVHLRIGESGNNMYLNANNGNAVLEFRTNSTERMRIDASGNVGIGTNSPTDNLSVGTLGSGSNSIITIGASTTGTSSI
jgi:hypothetical protein